LYQLSVASAFSNNCYAMNLVWSKKVAAGSHKDQIIPWASFIYHTQSNHYLYILDMIHMYSYMDETDCCHWHKRLFTSLWRTGL